MKRNGKVTFFIILLISVLTVTATYFLSGCDVVIFDGGSETEENTTNNIIVPSNTIADDDTAVDTDDYDEPHYNDETSEETSEKEETTEEQTTDVATETETEKQTTAAETTTAKETEPEPVKHGVTLSHEAGFYSKGFTLKMTSDGGTIYYTTDGSIPTNKSTKYTGGIKVIDATQNANVHSARTDVSTGFLEIVNAGYAAPSFNVDKCTIIRAIVYYKDGSTSPIETASYFVGFQNKDGYDNMRFISILTSPDNLFGYEKGIYVRGKTYDTYVYNKAHGTQKWFDPYWWWWDCNYNQKGIDTERPATIQIFTANHKLKLTKDVGIRIQGGGSRGKIPRSFNIYSRVDYDGRAKLDYKPFGTGYNPQRVTLFAGGDDNETKFKDWLMASLCSDLKFATMDFTQYVLFLDGEYWGNYWMTEKYDEDYIQYHYGVDKNNVVIVKNGALEEGIDGDINLYYDMRNYISGNDMSNETNYAKACELLDIDSYIQYFAAEIYIDRYNDWPGGNFACWRSKTAETGEYGDCKWRYMLFDVNSGALDIARANNNVADSINYVRERDSVFASLWNNKTFKQKFIEQLYSYSQNEFSTSNVTDKYNEFLSTLGANMEKEFNRFYADPSAKLEAFKKSIKDVKDFFTYRKIKVQSYCETFLGL